MFLRQVCSLRGVVCGCVLLVAVVTALQLLPSSTAAQEYAETVPAEGVVIFDNSRQQFWSPFDAGFFGYSELSIALREAGYLVTESNVPVTVSLTPLRPRGSILVMGTAADQWYSEKEIEAIVKYVEGGGGLLILAEPDPGAGDNFQNPLASKFGLLVLNQTVVDTTDSVAGTANQWIFGRSDFFGVERIGLPVSGHLMLAEPAFTIVAAKNFSPRFPPNAFPGGAVEYGEGRVVCIAESQFLINGGKKQIGIDCEQNREFALKIFDWLSRRERRVRTRIVPEFTTMTGFSMTLKVRVEGQTDLRASIQGGRIEPQLVENATGEVVFQMELNRDGYAEFSGSDGSRKVVLLLTAPGGGIGARLIFDTRGYGPEMGDPVNGMSEFAAILRDKGYWVYGVEEGLVNLRGLHGVVVVNPLRTDGRLYLGDVNDPGLHWIILGEPFSFIGVHNQLGEWFREKGFRDREIPVVTLCKQFGIDFLPYVIFEADSSRILGQHPTYPVLSYGVRDCEAFRCGVVDAEGGRPVLRASASAWGMEGVPGTRMGLQSMRPGPHDYKKRPVAALLKGNVFVLADMHVFSDQHTRPGGHWSLGVALADWMAGNELKVPEL
ncbi:MAG: hypothetical protein JSW03_09950 [Candidatus Eiseniibacteriota bacterium]|nr:MAG: hypothetical protein JSW03_09950 [Candidatus Eisenbacteria bacterium]